MPLPSHRIEAMAVLHTRSGIAYLLDLFEVPTGMRIPPQEMELGGATPCIG